MKNSFLNNKVKSASAKKSYITLFKRIEEQEELIGKKIELWNKQDCIDLLSSCGSKKYNTIMVKWSLLKKYLIFIENTVYRDISKEDLERIEDRVLRYVDIEELIKEVDKFKNNIDKAIILLLRNGIKGNAFEELRNLKTKDINGNVIKLKDREVELNDYTTEVVHKAINERGYRMTIKEGKKSNYDYYNYNMESEYFWKNRPNKYNNEGLNSMKANASKDKIVKLIKKINIENLSSTSLVISYVVDEILKFEKEMGMSLTESQVSAFIKKIGVKANMYSVYVMKNEIKSKK